MVAGEKQHHRGTPKLEALVEAIAWVQDGARARVVDPVELASRVMADWRLVERAAEAIGLRPQDLGASGSWWIGSGDDHRDRHVTQTIVSIGHGYWSVDRKTPHYGNDPRKVGLRLDAAAIKKAKGEPAGGGDGARAAAALELVRRLQHQLGWRTHCLGSLLSELEELPEPRLEPEEVRDGVEDAARLLEELVHARTCVVCGCTHQSPCETAAGPCGWARGEVHADDTRVDICTACVDLVDELELLEGDDDARGDGPEGGEE